MRNKLELLGLKFKYILDKEAANFRLILNKLSREEQKLIQLDQYEIEYLKHLEYLKTEPSKSILIKNYYFFLEHLADIKVQQNIIVNHLKVLKDKSQETFNKAHHKNSAFKEFLKEKKLKKAIDLAHNLQKQADNQITDWFNNINSENL